jgi:hypothetical protein
MPPGYFSLRLLGLLHFEMAQMVSIFSKAGGVLPQVSQLKSEYLEAHWNELDVLYSTLLLTLPDTVKQTPAFGELGAKLRERPPTWTELNKAELLLVAYMGEAMLNVEFKRKVALAATLGVPSVDQAAAYEAARLLQAPAELEALREAYRALLFDIHREFVDRRFQRQERLAMALRLIRFASIVLSILLLPVLLFILHNWGETAASKLDFAKRVFVSYPVFGLYTVAAFGIFGAFFSRLLSFQRRAAVLRYDEMLHAFSARFLAVRCCIGMFGAIVFYFLLLSDLVSGAMFPKMGELAIVPFELKQGAGGGARDGSSSSGIQALIPSLEFAKLAIWSFLAGFSERLVPDALERTEARAVQAQAEPVQGQPG